MSIAIVDDDGKEIETFPNVDDMFKEMDIRFKKEHPFLSWYDETMYKNFGKDRWFYFSYSPHTLLIEPSEVILQALREIRWAYQRVVDGVDERASWGVGSWLNEVMPKVLMKISGSEYGTPFAFFDDAEDDSYEARKKADKKYDQVLIDLIWAFEEMKKLEDFDIKQYSDVKEAIADYQVREIKAKEKLKLLIDYFWEIGD